MCSQNIKRPVILRNRLTRKMVSMMRVHMHALKTQRDVEGSDSRGPFYIFLFCMKALRNVSLVDRLNKSLKGKLNEVLLLETCRRGMHVLRLRLTIGRSYIRSDRNATSNLGLRQTT